MAQSVTEPLELLDANSYQTFLTIRDEGDPIVRVGDQLESWLGSKKGWDPPTDTTGYFLGPDGKELLVAHNASADGSSFRARLTERTATGTWRTALTVHEGRAGHSWVGVRVKNDQGRFANVPWLVIYLLEGLSVWDADTWLSASPRTLHLPDVDLLMEEIGHIERRGLYLVAGSDDGGDLAAFESNVARWTEQTRGLAQAVVLDAPATTEFNQVMGKSHEVPPWTIRTFTTDVDPAVAANGRRHKILGRARLAEDFHAVQRTLGRAARRHSSQLPRPDEFRTVHRRLHAIEDRVLADALFTPVRWPRATEGQGPPAGQPTIGTSHQDVQGLEPAQGFRPATASSAVVEEASRYLAMVELVKETLRLTSLDEAALREVAALADAGRAQESTIERVTSQLQDRRARAQQLTEELELYRSAADDNEEELQEANADRARLADENAWLRRMLADQGVQDKAWAKVPESELTDYPEDFDDLVSRLGSLAERGVVFTGDKTAVHELAEHDPLGRIAAVTWEVLLTLADYVRCRTDGHWEGGVRGYLEQTPDGYRSMPRKKFAGKESAATMQAWGDDRVFPVPTSLNPAGEEHMEAHFRLGRARMVSPRLYYLDRYTKDGKVYVGYIGSHLRNKHTN